MSSPRRKMVNMAPDPEGAYCLSLAMPRKGTIGCPATCKPQPHAARDRPDAAVLFGDRPDHDILKVNLAVWIMTLQGECTVRNDPARHIRVALDLFRFGVIQNCFVI